MIWVERNARLDIILVSKNILQTEQHLKWMVQMALLGQFIENA